MKKDVDTPLALYKALQSRFGNDVMGAANRKSLTECIFASIVALEAKDRRDLTSKIPGKQYFAFKSGTKLSRAVNKSLYLRAKEARDIWEKLVSCLASNEYQGLESHDITKAIYTAAISFCACIDMVKEGDQKTPGTFFEYLIGHVYSSRLGVNPSNRLDVLNLDMKSSLPTDFVFNLGVDRPKFHLPIKTSTRERVIQIWAHQRVLDGVYGTGRFLGTPVILAETKTDKKKQEVIEICLPDQWRIYQMHIAQLKRIYYLDVPDVYAKLNDVFPLIRIRPFGDFFFEIYSLTN